MSLVRGFGRRHVYLALGFTLVTQLAHATYALLGKEHIDWGPLGVWTVISFFLALIALACAVASDNLLGDHTRAGIRLVAAMLAAAMATAVTIEVVLQLVPQLEDKMVGEFVNGLHRIAYRFTLAAGSAFLLIPLYAMLQASRRATQRLHAVQLAALAAERGVLESDLRAMQGRVEPELLFDSLLAVDRAYERDVQAGQEALDALIRFLRAALPGDAAANATVAGEQELAEAYLALSAQRPQVDIAIAPETRTLPMPAMLLLPLVRWALESATKVEIRAQRRETTLEVSVRSDSHASAEDAEPGIAGVRERLARLFAGGATLDVSIGPHARQARLLIPAS